jgi:hypothetical protein
MNSLNQTISIQTLVQWALGAVGLGFAVFLGSMIAEGNYQALALILLLSVGFALYFGFSAFLWMMCICAIFIPGNLTFLPLGLKTFEVMLLAGTAHFFISQTVFKKTFPRIGPQPAGSWLLLFLVIVMLHGISDRFGVRLLGSDTWGGRAYLGILVSGLAYYCIQSMQFDVRKWTNLPLFVILISSADLGVKLVSYNEPQIGLLVSSFYSGTFNSDTFVEFSRWGFLGNFGYVLVTTALCYSTLTGMITRGNLVPPLLFLTGAALCLSSGYRSSLLFLFFLVIVGSIRDLHFKTLFLVPLLVTSLLALSWVHSSVYPLPQGMQRGLVWLPGDWDENLTLDAAGSDDFRWKVWAYWAQNKFPEAPLIGRGLGVPNYDILSNLDEATTIDPNTGETLMKFADRERSFTITGNLHNGFLSVVDRFGLVGAFCFFTFIIISFRNIFKVLFRTPVRYDTCYLHWIGIYICASILAYPAGALRIDDFFAPTVFMIGIFNVLAAGYDRAKADHGAKQPAKRPMGNRTPVGTPAPSAASL